MTDPTQKFGLVQKFGLDPQKLPRHVGIIMDGNGRWATEKRMPRVAGHRKGVDRVRETVETSAQLGVQSLTMFAFSDENWRRPEDEVSALMNLLRLYIRNEAARILKENIRFRMIGDRKKLSSDIVKLVEDLEATSAKNTGMFLNIALSYGSRGEILRAVKRLSQRIERGEVFANDIDEELFEEHLDTAGLPHVDMLIRTSGELRVSNFLLWQIAYAELFFTPTFWPDFDTNVYTSLLHEYAKRERRFGQTTEQLRPAIPITGVAAIQ